MKKTTLLSLLVFSALINGCTARTTSMSAEPVNPEALDNSGVAPQVWEEPMVDVIDVPPGLDPEGHYYRPAHSEIVEIRQGRWKNYKEK